MITEVTPTFFCIKIKGVVVVPNIPSRQLAEATLFNLPADQRVIAEIVPVTADGKSLLLG